jgi:hypothetical protein
VLGLDGELHRFGLGEVATVPHPVDQVEAEVSTERFFDQGAVPLPVRAARILTQRRTSSSIVSVVRTFAISAPWHQDAIGLGRSSYPVVRRAQHRRVTVAARIPAVMSPVPPARRERAPIPETARALPRL